MEYTTLESKNSTTSNPVTESPSESVTFINFKPKTHKKPSEEVSERRSPAVILATLILISTAVLYYFRATEQQSSQIIPSIYANLTHIPLISSLDFEAKPCDDFYQFSCGSWVKNIKENEDFVNNQPVSQLSLLEDRINGLLDKILKRRSEDSEDDLLVKQFYADCLEFFEESNRPEIESDENGDYMLEMPDDSHVDWIINLGNWPVINKPHAGHLQFTKSEIEDVIVEHYVNNPGNTALINIEKDADLGVLKLLPMDMILGSKEFYIFNQKQDNQVSPKTTDSEILQESSEQLKTVLREAYIEYFEEIAVHYCNDYYSSISVNDTCSTVDAEGNIRAAIKQQAMRVYDVEAYLSNLVGLTKKEYEFFAQNNYQSWMTGYKKTFSDLEDESDEESFFLNALLVLLKKWTGSQSDPESDPESEKFSKNFKILDQTADFFKTMEKTNLHFSLSPTDIKNYLVFRAVHQKVDVFPLEYRKSADKFRLATGIMPKQSECMSLAQKYYPKNLEAIFLDHDAGSERKIKYAKKMSKNIISSFSTILENAGWLNTRTKSSVIRKISAIAVNLEIGGGNPPSGYRTESKNLVYDRNQPFFNRVLEFEQQVFLTEQMTFQNTPVVKYLPSKNGLLITQALLNSPFLDLDSSDAINYGSLGVTIARELAHAFTPVNTRLDERGRVRVATEEQENKEKMDIEKMDIEKIDFEKMDTTAQKSKNNETNNNLPRYTTHGLWSRVNGRKEEKECFDDESSALENLALIAAFHAYSEYPMSREMSCGNQRLGMITPEQQFWISYSQQFCFAESELFESWREMVLLVPDADVFVGGTTGKIREFRESFECGVGSFGDCSFL